MTEPNKQTALQSAYDIFEEYEPSEAPSTAIKAFLQHPDNVELVAKSIFKTIFKENSFGDGWEGFIADSQAAINALIALTEVEHE